MTELSRLLLDHTDPLGAAVLYGPDDPTTVSGGVAAAVGTQYRHRTTGIVYDKIGPLSTDWAQTGQFYDKGGTVINAQHKDFGLLANGSDETMALASLMAFANARGGGRVVFADPTKAYHATTIPLYPGVIIDGMAGFGPQFYQVGSGNFFNWLGTAEAQSLDAHLRHLTLYSSAALTGTAVRVRNFSNVTLESVQIVGFDRGVKADWGIGVYLRRVQLSLCGRAMEIGGGTGGIRSAPATPFLDTVSVEQCSFSQNVLDIHDLGSTRALGSFRVSDTSFFESSVSPVTGKTRFALFVNRPGLVWDNNWVESPAASRVSLELSNVDADGNTIAKCRGVSVRGGKMLSTGAGATGVKQTACEGLVVGSVHFEFAAGAKPIDLADATNPAAILPNSYYTFDNTPGFTTPVTITAGRHAVLDPVVGTTRRIDLPLGNFVLSTGAPDRAVRGTNAFYEAWAFDAAATEIIAATFHLPSDYISGSLTVKLKVTNLGAGAGNVQWRVTIRDVAIAANINTAGPETFAFTLATSPAQDVLAEVTSTAVRTGASNLFWIDIGRQGADVADTLGNDAGLVGVTIEYTAAL